MSYDVATFYNAALGIVVGAGAATISGALTQHPAYFELLANA